MVKCSLWVKYCHTPHGWGSLNLVTSSEQNYTCHQGVGETHLADSWAQRQHWWCCAWCLLYQELGDMLMSSVPVTVSWGRRAYQPHLSGFLETWKPRSRGQGGPEPVKAGNSRDWCSTAATLHPNTVSAASQAFHPQAPCMHWDACIYEVLP